MLQNVMIAQQEPSQMLQLLKPAKYVFREPSQPLNRYHVNLVLEIHFHQMLVQKHVKYVLQAKLLQDLDQLHLIYV